LHFIRSCLETVLSISRRTDGQSVGRSVVSHFGPDRLTACPPVRLPQHHPRRPQLVVEQPALLGDPPAISDQATVLPDHPVAWDQDGEMVGRHQPPDLSRVKLGRPSDVVVGASLSQGDLADAVVRQLP